MARKKKYQYNGIGFDSTDQIYMYCWLLQLEQEKLISQMQLQPPSFPLSQKVTFNKRTLLHEHVYTCDFMVKFTQYESLPASIKEIFYIKSQDEKFYIQIKPSFDRSNMTRLFTINQKWLFKQSGIYVYKIEVDKLFQKTFVPEYCRYTQKTKKLRQKYKNFKTIKEIIL